MKYFNINQLLLFLIRDKTKWSVKFHDNRFLFRVQIRLFIFMALQSQLGSGVQNSWKNMDIMVFLPHSNFSACCPQDKDWLYWLDFGLLGSRRVEGCPLNVSLERVFYIFRIYGFTNAWKWISEMLTELIDSFLGELKKSKEYPFW